MRIARNAGPLLLFLLGLVSVARVAARPEAEGGEKVYQRTLKSTVWVLSPEGKRVAQGTGSLIDKAKRLVITNYHVIGEGDQVVAMFPAYQKSKLIPQRSHYIDLVNNGNGIRGKVVVRDKRKDLALVQLDSVPEGVQELKLARDSATPGQRVHSVGNPGRSGAMWLYTSGTVRQVYHKKWQSMGGSAVYNFEAEVVETQSPTNSGDSGGPLVNDRAELVGVTQGTANDAQLLSIFIDVSEVKGLLKTKGIAAKLAPPTPVTVPSDGKATAELTAEKSAEADPSEQRAASKFKFAQQLADEGKKEPARKRCEEIVKQFPKTEAAKEAKALLDKLMK